MSKKILITGGTGFIGYHLSKKCLRLGWSVTSLSSKYPKNSKKVKGVNYLVIDISNKKKLSKIGRNFDYIVNLAGYVDHSKKKKTLQSHYNVAKIWHRYLFIKKFKNLFRLDQVLNMEIKITSG